MAACWDLWLDNTNVEFTVGIKCVKLVIHFLFKVLKKELKVSGWHAGFIRKASIV